MDSTLLVWVGLFIVAFALMAWPHVNGEAFSSPNDLEPLGFVDALYYSGGTGTVLGFAESAAAYTVSQAATIVPRLAAQGSGGGAWHHAKVLDEMEGGKKSQVLVRSVCAEVAWQMEHLSYLIDDALASK